MKWRLTAIACLAVALLAAASTRCFANVRSSSPLPGISIANGPTPIPDLRGETVSAIVGETDTQVEAVYDISDFSTSADSVLLPFFAGVDESPDEVVRHARLQVSLNGKPLSGISIGTAPGGTPPVRAEVQIVWARINTHDVRPRPTAGEPLNLRVSYRQRHIGGKFYYLPQSIPFGADDTRGHNWRYPLIARAPNRTLVFAAGDCTWERLDDVLVVYHRHPVDQVRKRGTPAGRQAAALYLR